MNHVKVLLIEDNTGDARLIQEMLRDAEMASGGTFSCNIVYVERLSSGIARLALGGIDVVILDLSLPDAHGFDMFGDARLSIPRAPVIVLTGLEDEQIIRTAMKRGAQDYLVKGKIDGGILVRAIRHAMERHRLLVELEEARKQEQHAALHDALTGLPNRQLFYDRLQQSIARAERYKEQFAVLFFDLDHFKEINDSLGHDVGDQLLLQVGKRLLNSFRKSDTVARLGGDEFLALLHHIALDDDAVKSTQHALGLLAKSYIIKDMDLKISASIGIAMYPKDGHDVHTIIHHADMAMYEAKEKGGNKYRFYYDVRESVSAKKELAVSGMILAKDSSNLWLPGAAAAASKAYGKQLNKSFAYSSQT